MTADRRIERTSLLRRRLLAGGRLCLLALAAWALTYRLNADPPLEFLLSRGQPLAEGLAVWPSRLLYSAGDLWSGLKLIGLLPEPVFRFFVYVLFWAKGPSYASARLANTVPVLAAGWILYLLLRRHGGRLAGCLGLLLLFSNAWWLLAGRLAVSEAWLSFFILLFLYWRSRPAARPPAWFASCLFGWAVFGHPAWLIPFLALPPAGPSGRRRLAVWSVGLLAGFMAAWAAYLLLPGQLRGSLTCWPPAWDISFLALFLSQPQELWLAAGLAGALVLTVFWRLNKRPLPAGLALGWAWFSLTLLAVLIQGPAIAGACLLLLPPLVFVLALSGRAAADPARSWLAARPAAVRVSGWLAGAACLAAIIYLNIAPFVAWTGHSSYRLSNYAAGLAANLPSDSLIFGPGASQIALGNPWPLYLAEGQPGTFRLGRPAPLLPPDQHYFALSDAAQAEAALLLLGGGQRIYLNSYNRNSDRDMDMLGLWKIYPGLTVREADLPSGAGELAGRYYFPAGWTGGPVIIFSHPASQLGQDHPFVRLVCLELARCGYAVFTFDYRGYGRSPEITEVRSVRDLYFPDDLKAAVKLVRAQLAGRLTKLVLLGHSFGAGPTLVAGFGDPAVDGLVAIGPGRRNWQLFLSPQAPEGVEPIRQRMMLEMKFRQPPPAAVVRQVTEAIIIDRFARAEFRQPLLLIDGGREQPADRDFLAGLVRTMSGDVTYVTVPGAKHYFGMYGRRVEEIPVFLDLIATLDKWLKEKIG